MNSVEKNLIKDSKELANRIIKNEYRKALGVNTYVSIYLPRTFNIALDALITKYPFNVLNLGHNDSGSSPTQNLEYVELSKRVVPSKPVSTLKSISKVSPFTPYMDLI